MNKKMKAFGMDANGRSTWTEVDIPFKEVTALHAETAKQDGGYWGISINQPGEPIGGGPEEMHLTNQPRMVWAMSGHLDNKLQSGEVRSFVIHGRFRAALNRRQAFDINGHGQGVFV